MTPDISHQRRDIQGLRALAVLMVIAFHAGLPVPGGFIGVDVFFVISGFVITAMLHREWLTTGAIRFRRFYARRFKRLTPALALMVAVTLLLSIPLLSPFGTQQVTAQTALGAMFLMANVVIASATGGYFDPAAEINPLLNTWSLSVEEQFYLVFPAVLFFGWWLARRRLKASAVVLVAGVALVSFGAAYLNSIGQVGPRTEFLFGFYGPLSRAWEFAVGALIALGLSRIQRWPGWSAQGLAWIGAIGLVSSLWLIDDGTPFPGPWTLLPVLSTVAIIIAGSRVTERQPAVSRLLATRPLVATGDVSYSLYLWHWPLIVFAALLWPGNEVVLLAAALVSVAPALVSYRWVEEPIRQMAMRPVSRLLGLAAVVVLVPSLLAGALWAGAQRFWGLGDLSRAAAAEAEWEALAEECLDLSTTVSVPTRVGAEGCTWNPESTGTPVYLVGDSAAAQYLAGVREAAEAQGSPVTLIAAAHCPLTTAMRVNNVTGETTDSACDDHNEQTLTQLAKATPGIVLLVSSNRYWYVDDDGFTTDPDQRDPDPGVSRVALEEGIADVVDQLQRAGHDVVLVAPTFTFLNGQLATPERMTLYQLLDRDVSLTVPITVLESGQMEARRSVQRIADSFGAPVLDLQEWQCPTGQCPAFMGDRGDVLVYADSAHLSQDASRLLTDRFGDVLGTRHPAG